MLTPEDRKRLYAEAFTLLAKANCLLLAARLKHIAESKRLG